MPIFVKGELLRQDDETQLAEFLDEQSLLNATLPSRDEEADIVDLDAKEALDVIQRTINFNRQKAPLADDLSSVGSMYQKSTPMSIVRPIADYETNPDAIPNLIRRSRKELSINTAVDNDGEDVQDEDEAMDSSTTKLSSSTTSSSSYHHFNSRATNWERRNNTATNKPRLTVVTDVSDESRDDPLDARYRGSSTAVMDRDLCSPSTSVNGNPYADAEEDEPSRTLEDLLGLLEKGYRVKLHTFRGRERAFLYLGHGRRKLVIKTNAGSRKNDEGTLYLETSIENVVNLEFGRRSDSGFLLSPLTSFSLGIAHTKGSSQIKYYDLEAASPVQREVLVSTLMIMMDAFGSTGTGDDAAHHESPSEVLVEMDTSESAHDMYPTVLEDETGTFDQPILCSPSLEPIPCSPSLEMESTQNSPENKKLKDENEVIRLEDVDSFVVERDEHEREQEHDQQEEHRVEKAFIQPRSPKMDQGRHKHRVKDAFLRLPSPKMDQSRHMHRVEDTFIRPSSPKLDQSRHIHRVEDTFIRPSSPKMDQSRQMHRVEDAFIRPPSPKMDQSRHVHRVEEAFIQPPSPKMDQSRHMHRVEEAFIHPPSPKMDQSRNGHRQVSRQKKDFDFTEDGLQRKVGDAGIHSLHDNWDGIKRQWYNTAANAQRENEIKSRFTSYKNTQQADRQSEKDDFSTTSPDRPSIESETERSISSERRTIKQVDKIQYYLGDSNSSGDITHQTSNVTESVVPVVTVADDLVIEAHLSDQAFSDQGSVSGGTEQPCQPESHPSTRDDAKEEMYVFKEEESVLGGSAKVPIDAEMDPIMRLRSKAHALSFSFSDQSYDADGDSVQGMIHSVRTRRLSRPYDASTLTKPSYPARILEVEELHEMSMDESPSCDDESKCQYSFNEYKSRSGDRNALNGDAETSHPSRNRPQPTYIEKTALVDIKPKLEVPTPHSLHLSASSSQLIGGWCSDDVCTGTLNDMAKSCTGIFGTEQAKAAMSHAACLDPSLTDAQTAMLEEYITSALGAPSAVYSYFTADGERVRSSAQSTDPQSGSSPFVTEVPKGPKFRNRAARTNAQANRLRSLKTEMTFANALKQSKEMTFLRSTQSFDDANILPKLADKAAKKLHSSPLLDSLVSNMIHPWTNEATHNKQGGSQNTEDESVYYDSDPEDSRPRTMHQGPRKVRPVGVNNADKVQSSRPKALDGLGLEHMDAKLGKRADEDMVKEIVQSMMNERLLVMWHPTQSKQQPNRAPILARLWIESGVYLIDGSFLLPKLSWVKAFGQPKGLGSSTKELNKVDLLDICRIRSCTQVDRSLHPFANARLSWIIETQNDVLLFESETTEERDRIVYGLKLVVARLASLLMLRDIRAADEFFGAVSSGVPGEAPTWAARRNHDEQSMGDERSTAAPSTCDSSYQDYSRS